MTEKPDINPDLDLVLERVVDVRPALLWEAWTNPEHLKHWFAPKPWEITSCDMDVRPGGVFSFGMRSPDGQEIPPNPGCYLEVVPNRKLVMTDALGPGFRPKAEAFSTSVVLFEPEGEGARYTAIAIHKDPADRKKHEAMGFHDGWSTVLDQLVAYVRRM